MIRKLDLIALLERIPGNPPITTWDPTHAEEHDIEEIVDVDGPHGRALVLGMEVHAEGETVWGGK